MIDKSNKKANKKLKRISVLIFCIMAAVATALVCVFCFTPSKKVGVDEVGGGEVVTSTSATYSTAGTYDFTSSSATGNIADNKVGKLVNGDVLTFSSCGDIYTITIPKGEYTLEVWGAQGGTGDAGAGGKGGYAYGTYNTTTTTTTIYIVPGGQGESSNGHTAISGGYNGGGDGATNTSNSTSNKANRGSGGGATHIATKSGLLSSLSSAEDRKTVLIVAGGGGGSGGDGKENTSGVYATVGGDGGGVTGAKAADSTGESTRIGGSGGTANSGGASGNYSGNAGTATDGSFGQGGTSGCASNNWYCGGGGGGGWYGGGGGGPAGPGGGGGSGYIGGVTSGSMQSGIRSGAGMARITVVNVNQDPVANAYTVPGSQKLGAASISIAASSLAEDKNDGADQTAAQKKVYFANSKTDMSFTAGNTTNLYVDENCTTNLSNDYFDYKFENNQTLKITKFKKLPRAGDGTNMSNNSITAYVVLRDNYNSSTLSQCGYCVSTITINFAKSTISHGSNTSGISSGTNKYRFGDNSTMDSSTVSSGGIYSKNQTGRFALTVEKPIKRGDSVTITAKELLTGYEDDNNHYKALIVVPKAADTGAPYSITLNPADKVVFSDWNGTSATDTSESYANNKEGYTKITINGVNAHRNWQSHDVMLYVVENSTNKEPSQITYTGGYASDSKQLLELNFKCDNTRPVLRTAPINGAPTVINVPLGQTVDVDLNDYFEDQDDGNTLSASTHSVQAVEVPQKEFVQIDKYSSVVSTVNKGGATGGKSYYNIGSSLSGALDNATSDVSTGFDLAIASKTADPNAFVKYGFSGITVSLTGLRSSYSQYLPTRASQTAYTGGTVSSPSGTAPVENPGHFYLLINIRDNNETEDGGIYLPIAVTVGAVADENAKPKNTGTKLHTSSGQGDPVSAKPTADGKPDEIFRFTPMAVNIGGTLQPIGQYKSGKTLSDEDLQPLAIDADNFATSNGLSTWKDVNRSGKLNEFLTLNNVTVDSIYTSIGANASQYVTVSLIDIYVPQSYFGGRVVAGASSTPGVYTISSLGSETVDGVDYYKTKGIQIQLKSATMNRFIHATVDVADSSLNVFPTSHISVDIAIRVTNKAPKILDKSKIVTDVIGTNSGVTYALTKTDSGINVPTITYKVPAHTTFMITPYDLIYDPDMHIESGEARLSPAGGFTLNGLSGVYDNGKFIQGKKVGDADVGKNAVGVDALLNSAKYGMDNSTYIGAIKSMLTATDETRMIKKTSTVNTFTTPIADKPMFNDKLFFVRSDYNGTSDAYTFNPIANGSLNFLLDSRNTTNYIEWKLGNSITVDGTHANMDFILVQAKSRTSVPAEIDLIVRDRYGVAENGVGTQIKIVIEILNTAPKLNDNIPAVELAAKPITVKDETGEHTVTNSEALVSVEKVMTDNDNDPISYITSNGVIVANTPDLAEIYKNMTSFTGIDRKYLVDKYSEENAESGNLLSEYYVSAEFNGVNLTITALNSTKNIENGVYVYFFATDKKMNGDAIGCIQIEVLNSLPEMNRNENGFDETNIWKVTSTSGADISRSRYIVGSETAYNEVSKLGAVPSDVKLIANDVDALQRGVILSPRGSSSYINLVGESYDSAVPDFTKNTSGIPTSDNLRPYAVAAYMTEVDGGKADVPDDFTIELNYLVNGTWYTREALVDGLVDGSVAKSLCFDENGRWLVEDWAIRLQATIAFESGSALALEISLRDGAQYGGDTAGETTAYQTDRKLGNMAVTGKLAKDPIVFLSISGTGISTKDMYAQYNNYYVVEVDKKVGNATQTTAYISTYDGDKTSVYEDSDNATRIAYNTVDGKNTLDSTGSIEIKPGTGADGTLAGTNSGALFDKTASYGEQAYKYPDRIVIPGTNDPTSKSGRVVYVPMSFFGMLKTFVGPDSATGAVSYVPDYVGYDVRTGSGDKAYNKGDIESIQSAITLTDSRGGIWTGATLNDNPYIDIDAVDFTSSMNGADCFGQADSKAYYNTRIGTNTIGPDGYLLGYEKKDSGNLNSFVGNGEIMYLEDQATKLKEHNFGLSFVKANMRTTDDLTLTVKLAKSVGGYTAVGDEEEQNARSVSVKIRVENGMFDLVKKENLNYDSDKGTYYVDVTMPSDSTKRFSLMRDGHDTDGIENATDDVNNALKIYYTDTDYDAEDFDGRTYRDFAYFSADSFGRVDSWDGTLSRKSSGEGAESNFVNTSSSVNAKNSLLHYYGAANAAAADTVNSNYQPNPGKYGLNNGTNGSGLSGYGSYFSATTTGRLLTFTSIKKTYINEDALKSITQNEFGEFGLTWNGTKYGGLTQKQLTEIYKSRGLVVVYNGEDENATVSDGDINKVYYPFKTIVYDSAVDSKDGWNEASYTAVEFRIQITNAKAKLKTDILNGKDGKKWVSGDKYYDILLSVGSNIEVNLYNFVEDPDILVMSGEDLTLATRGEFLGESGITLETADYLESLFKYTPIGDATGRQEAAQGVTSFDGLSKSGSKYYDVIMSMPTGSGSIDATTSPQSNHLRFAINRRTTVKTKVDGKDVISDKTEFEFTVKFCDNHAETDSDYTDKVIFRVKVNNQAPWVTTDVREITMRSGDSFTLLTSFYDTFEGGMTGGTDAYKNSLTYNSWDDRENSDVSQNFDPDGDKTNGWDFKTIDSTWASKFVSDTSKKQGDGVHLGFIGIGNDDTAWKLRILSYPYTTNYFKFVSQNRMLVEGTDHSGEILPTALTVTASRACDKYDFQVMLIDGDGKSQSYVLRISVVSNAPIARDPDDPTDYDVLTKKAGLDGVLGSGGYIEGTFRTFVKPYSDSEVMVDGFNKVKARHKITIDASDVAKDLDVDETEKMTFYNGGGFSVDNVVLTRDKDTNVYHAQYFDISVALDNKSFTLTCTGYNPDREYETLTFAIGDYGDASKYVNITIQVYTVYADITNKTVADYSNDQYKKYLGGSNVVNVKSADKYNGRGVYEGDETVIGKESVYAYMDFENVVGNDGNNDSPINDPDVKVAGKQTYAVNMYAFITNDGDALTAAQLEPLFVRNGETDTFLLKSRNGSAGEGLGNITDYLIGGVDENNGNISVTSNAIRKLALVRSYVDFTFDQYGTSVMFIPKTATLDTNLMLYIEVQKPLGSRGAKRTDGVIFGGTLFCLQVEDSAPISVNQSGQADYDVAVYGAKGDYAKLKIFDSANAGGTLFTDTDYGDVVTIAGFDPARDTDADYREALALALSQDASLDWNSDPSKGKSRAFDIEINNTDAAVRTHNAPKDVNAPDYNDDRYILEPHTLIITVNRRIDKLVNGKYASEVTFPIVLKGKDTTPTSAAAESVINLTIKNTEIDAVDSYSYYDYDPTTQRGSKMGYSFAHDDTDPDLYVIDALIAPHESLSVSLTDFIVDKDYSASGDTDSFRFVSGVDKKPYAYLTDSPIEIKHYTNIDFDEGSVLATVTPMRAGDVNHMTGFTITAASTARAKTATFYLRVIDRAGDENAMIGDYLYQQGIWIKVNVTLLNARPTLIPSMQDKPLTLLGSNREAITYGPFSIGDYVTDENDTDVVGDEASALNPDTYLRISSTGYQLYDSLYSTIGTTAVGGGSDTSAGSSSGVNTMSSALFELIPASGGYNQTFTITTRKGYYGVGSFDIVVSDGNSNVRDDTLSVSFTVRVEVIYNPDELPTLNGVTLAACKTTSVTIESLIPEIDNVLTGDPGVSQSALSMNAGSKAEGKFAPSRDYVLMNVEPSEDAKQYVAVEHEEGSFAWTLRALKRVTAEPKEVNVTYALESDHTQVYNNSFLITILENKRPELIYNEITFIRYVDETESDAFMLNTSNTAYLRADQILHDPENDVMRFDSVKSQKPSLISASLSDNKQMIGITFNARGTSKITVSVIDETGDAVSRTFLVINNDLPEPSLWMRITSSFESNKVLWAVIIGCIVLLIIILIIILAVHRKKKREREELEALLVSEMEIEEQMYRLAGGPSPTGYQSFGYLQSAPGQTADPSMMLGMGGGAQVTPPELALPPAAPNGDMSAQQAQPQQQQQTTDISQQPNSYDDGFDDFGM